jgi:hypothetical protein
MQCRARRLDAVHALGEAAPRSDLAITSARAKVCLVSREPSPGSQRQLTTQLAASIASGLIVALDCGPLTASNEVPEITFQASVLRQSPECEYVSCAEFRGCYVWNKELQVALEQLIADRVHKECLISAETVNISIVIVT